MYILFTMWSKLWMDIFVLVMFLRKEDFPCPFFLPALKGNLGDKFARCLDLQESRADDELSAVELQIPRSWMGEYFSPFFRSHRRECLAELKFGELLRRRLREWQRSERAMCYAIQCFLSGEKDDQQWRLCCGLELKKLQPVRQRSDESQGLKSLQDGLWKCFIHNEETSLLDPTGAVEQILSI